MIKTTMRATRSSFALAALSGLLYVGCTGSAPDDVFVDANATEALVFVKAERAETLNEGGIESNLYVLQPISPNGRVRNLTNMTDAAISDPCVSFDGKKVLFSMDPPGAGARNIYEINLDGTGLRQITDNGGDDFDPIYLPDDRILFTSNRDGERDEYNTAAKEVMYTCNPDGSDLKRVSFNLSDDFDPFLISTGRIGYTRWEHHGTTNRFPLAQVNPDGTSFFMLFGPHGRNIFHTVETRDGRFIGINSTRVEGDAGQLVLMSIPAGSDPEQMTEANYAVLTPQITLDGPPYPTGSYKYPNVLPDRDGKRQYVVSFTLPAATEDEVDYALYSFAVERDAHDRDVMQDQTLLWNDPATDELDPQLVTPRARPPIIAAATDENQDSGIFVGEDIYARGFDGQERPERGSVSQIMLVEGVPTMAGMGGMEISSTEFERKRILGFAPVETDGSFAVRVPANTPLSVHTLDELGRTRVFQRTWVYVRPGERRTFCAGCHAPRDGSVPSNENPMALNITPHDVMTPVNQRQVINFQDTIGPLIAAKCTGCHVPTIAPPDTIPAPGGLDLRMSVDPDQEDGFPVAYLSLVGEEMMGGSEFVTVPFSRQSPLIDVVMGIGANQGMTPHPGEIDSTRQLTPAEMTLLFRWIDLGGQYR